MSTPTVFGAVKETLKLVAAFAEIAGPENVATEPAIEPVQPFGGRTVTFFNVTGSFIVTFVVGDPAHPCETVNVTVADAPGAT